MDKQYFEQAAIEVSQGQLDTALMAKAIALALGDETKAKATYLSLRAEELQSENRRERIGAATSQAANLARSGTIAAGNAALSATGILWPALLKLIKFAFWALLIFVAVAFFLHKYINNSIRSEYPQLTSGTSPVSTSNSIIAPPRDYPLGSTRHQQDIQYDAMLDQLESQYSQADPKSKGFNRQFVAQLESQVAAHERQGIPGPVALQRAARNLSGVELTIPAAEN